MPSAIRQESAQSRPRVDVLDRCVGIDGKGYRRELYEEAISHVLERVSLGQGR